MFSALIISVSLIVVASLLRKIRFANLSLKRAELAHAETLQYLADVSYERDLLSYLTVEESGQVSFLSLVPDDPTILVFDGLEIDYGSLLSYERGNSDSIVVYNL